MNKKIKHYQLKIANRITQKHWNKHIPGLSYSYIELYIHLTELNAKFHNDLTIQEINNIKNIVSLFIEFYLYIKYSFFENIQYNKIHD